MLLIIGGILFVVGCVLLGIGLDTLGVITAYLGVVFVVAEHARSRAEVTHLRFLQKR